MSPPFSDPDFYTKNMCLTSTYHRSVYPALQSAQTSAAGKIVLITGASKGLGYYIARAWAAGGAAGLVICARSATSLESVAQELKVIKPDIKILTRACDTTRPEDVEALFLAIKNEFGRLDVVVANVGVASAASPLGTGNPEEWWDRLTTNIRSPQLTAHYFLKIFGPSPTGTFVIMTSGAAAVVMPGLSGYGTAKQACVRLAEFLDVECPELHVFSLDPGIVKGLASLKQFVPFAVVEPELVGAFTVWLGSGKARGCRGGYVHAAWDVGELQIKEEEIQAKGLVKSKFLGGILGAEGGAL
jgi:NAD(P)-dependent dehydrogenase (short-subunit alcohol dehydrogenase family)